jgi:hypothetical protein
MEHVVWRDINDTTRENIVESVGGDSIITYVSSSYRAVEPAGTSTVTHAQRRQARSASRQWHPRARTEAVKDRPSCGRCTS